MHHGILFSWHSREVIEQHCWSIEQQKHSTHGPLLSSSPARAHRPLSARPLCWLPGAVRTRCVRWTQVTGGGEGASNMAK